MKFVSILHNLADWESSREQILDWHSSMALVDKDKPKSICLSHKYFKSTGINTAMKVYDIWNQLDMSSATRFILGTLIWYQNHGI